MPERWPPWQEAAVNAVCSEGHNDDEHWNEYQAATVKRDE
jgi:hypothetical protein